VDHRVFTICVMALARTSAVTRGELLARHLRVAIDSRDMIGQAKGRGYPGTDTLRCPAVPTADPLLLGLTRPGALPRPLSA
jgi:hypothetical protein